MSSSSVLNQLRNRREIVLQQQRRQQQGQEEDEENPDDEDEDDENDLAGDYANLFQFLQRSSMGFGLGGSPNDLFYTSSNDPSRRSGLVSGQAFVESMNQKRES